jgi:hypothetical protein
MVLAVGYALLWEKKCVTFCMIEHNHFMDLYNTSQQAPRQGECHFGMETVGEKHAILLYLYQYVECFG